MAFLDETGLARVWNKVKALIPTKTSELTNDSGFLTQHQDISGKVDKVSGKALSTNDYTTAEKTKLSGIAEGAEVNVQSDWNATSGDAFIKNKPTIPTVPTNVSAFTNDAGYLTEHQDVSGKQDTLVSGTNIKTINNQSILGSGNINISGGGLTTPLFKTAVAEYKLPTVNAHSYGSNVTINSPTISGFKPIAIVGHSSDSFRIYASVLRLKDDGNISFTPANGTATNFTTGTSMFRVYLLYTQENMV